VVVCGRVLILSCVVLLSLCVCVCDLFLFSQGAAPAAAVAAVCSVAWQLGERG